MATRCCWPPESSSGRAVNLSASPTRQELAGFRLALVALAAEHVLGAGQHVLEHVRVGEEIELLKDHADAAAKLT